ncbi:MAG: ATP-binding cassette domain-containing protein [Candidatus Cloacimonetes bacterium]|nr:ATP-binding cassette domain-containing protein [Candidatus Cloacimonadota bacterium]
MQLTFSSFTVNNIINQLDLSFPVEGITVLYDETESAAEMLLRCLIGLDRWKEGQIWLDDTELTHYIEEKTLINTFAYVFEDGTMMSNLSLRENLWLPYQLRWKGEDPALFDKKLAVLMKRLDLDIDLRWRPAFIKPAQRKQLCYIQAILLQPTILLINNPSYLLNRKQRALLQSILAEQAPGQAMIIASSDDDFTREIADRTVRFDLTSTELSARIE